MLLLNLFYMILSKKLNVTLCSIFYIMLSSFCSSSQLQAQPVGKGFGFSIDSSKNGVVISYVIKTSPADKAGLKAGEIVKSVNKNDFKNYSLQQFLDYLQTIPDNDNKFEIASKTSTRTVKISKMPYTYYTDTCLSGNCINGFGGKNMKDGSFYSGNFLNGKQNGKGKLEKANGRVYEGDFKDDKAFGHGVFKTADGYTFEGIWDGNPVSGKGVLVAADGTRYDGEVKEGRRNGHGVVTMTNGSVYDGNYINDVPMGKGVFLFADGRKYTGDFANGKKDGMGVFTWPNGDKYIGGYKNDVKHGAGEMFTSNDKKTVKGNWENGTMQPVANEIKPIVSSRPLSANSKWAAIFEQLKNAQIILREYDMNDPINQKYIDRRDDGRYFKTFAREMFTDSVLLFKIFSEQRLHFGFGSKKILTSWNTIEPKSYFTLPWSIYSSKKNDTLNYYVVADDTIKIKFTRMYITLPIIWMEDFKEMNFDDKVIALALSSRFGFANILDYEKGLNRDTLYTGKITSFGAKGGDFTESIFIPNNKNGGYSINKSEKGAFVEHIASGIKKQEMAIEIAKEFSVKVANALKALDLVTTKCGPNLPKSCGPAVLYSEEYVLPGQDNSASIIYSRAKEYKRFIISIEVNYNMLMDLFSVNFRINSL